MKIRLSFPAAQLWIWITSAIGQTFSDKIIPKSYLPVVSVFADGGIISKVVIAALGAAVTGIGAYLSLRNYKELWNLYRVNREMLLSTLYLYFNHVGVFKKDIDQEDRDAMLIDMCEKNFQQDYGNWKSIIE